MPKLGYYTHPPGANKSTQKKTSVFICVHLWLTILIIRTYAHSTLSWRSWRLGGRINQDFWQFLRKSSRVR